MSLILKGIDLPTKDQVIVIHSDGTFNEVDPFARRLMPLYKVIQIPKGHGRLIDENKIDIPSTSVDIFENCRNCNLLDDEQVKEIIENAPTILESEGDE